MQNILLTYTQMSDMLNIEIRKSVKKGGKHTVEFTVTDYCGNETVARESFVW